MRLMGRKMIRRSIIGTLVFCILAPAKGIDISLKGDTCSSLDLCKSEEKSEVFRTCDCDEECNKYGTCCVDADNFPLMASQRQEYQCYDNKVVTPVFVKRTCADTFKAHDAHRNACVEAESDNAEVLGNLLVTSSKTMLTYWNKDCAICNNEDLHDLSYWTVQVACPSQYVSTRVTQKYIREHLHFDKEEDKWGLKFNEVFVECFINIYQPSNSVGQLRYCAPKMVGSCPAHYPDVEATNRCLSYHGERKDKSANRYFKNIHCALCNGVSLKQLHCVGRNYIQKWGYQSEHNTVKVIFDDGEWLERTGKEKFKCGKDFSYDPFWQKCRKYTHPSTTNSAQTIATDISFILVVFVFLYNKIHFK